jgi:hypothetical protein
MIHLEGLAEMITCPRFFSTNRVFLISVGIDVWNVYTHRLCVAESHHMECLLHIQMYLSHRVPCYCKKYSAPSESSQTHGKFSARK